MKDMIGVSKCGWRIVKEGARDRNRNKQWVCQCDCGFERLYTTSYFNSPELPQKCHRCRVKSKKDKDVALVQSHVGKQYGSFTVVKLEGRNKHGSRTWLCRCRCGVERRFLTSNLFGNGKRKATQCELCCIKEMELENRITDKVPNRFWRKFLSVAANRSKIVSFTQKQAYNLYKKQNGKCALTGLDLYFTKLTTRFNRYTNASIDRIDSSKPYDLDNIQWVHKKINMMKYTLSQEEFIQFCELVVVRTRDDQSGKKDRANTHSVSNYT